MRAAVGSYKAARQHQHYRLTSIHRQRYWLPVCID
jgi:hypothetical protein